MLKKKDKYISIRVNLPENFEQTIKEIMNDEFAIACRKWNVKLSEDEKNKVLRESTIQLQHKAELIFHRPWKINNDSIEVLAKSEITLEHSITLPDDNIDKYNIKLYRAKDIWYVSSEPNSSTILLRDFSDAVIKDVKTWTRTAVFYGVGSYL